MAFFVTKSSYEVRLSPRTLFSYLLLGEVVRLRHLTHQTPLLGLQIAGLPQRGQGQGIEPTVVVISLALVFRFQK